jgi:two-component system phosphate regulon sensor histidine kinase PhoR
VLRRTQAIEPADDSPLEVADVRLDPSRREVTLRGEVLELSRKEFLRLQLLVAFAYVLLLIIVALEVPLALNLARRIDAGVKNDAATQAFVVSAGASGRIDQPRRLAQLVRRAGDDLGARVIVVNAKGRLLADSTVAFVRPLSYASRPEIKVALGGGRAQGERHSDTLGEDLLYTAVPVTNGGRVVAAVRVAQSLEAVHSKVRRGVLSPCR